MKSIKRLWVIGLVLIMVVGVSLLGGCAKKEAPAAAPADAANAPVAASTEVIKLKIAHTNQKTESGGKIADKFCDYIEEKTNGKVKFERYPGGVLGNPLEMLGLVSSGSVDVVPLAHMPYGEELPLLNFPSWVAGDAKGAVDYFNKICLENPETAALVQAEATAKNIKYLGFVAGGANVFISKTPFAALADLKGKKFGAGGSQDAFSALGLTIVNMFPPDGYESLSRGVVDATQMAFVPTVNLKWYEVAKNYMFDGTYAAGNPFTINLDTWNKLPADIQQIFMDAAKVAQDYSLELDAADLKTCTATLEAAGVKVGTLSKEDIDKWFTLLYESNRKIAMDRGGKLGIVDKMTTVLNYADQLTGQKR